MNFDQVVSVPRADHPPHGTHAFTLPEMLAVIALIVIIISMLLPAFGKSRESVRNVECMVKQRQIGQAMMTFSVEHKLSLPGCYLPPWSGSDPSMRSWMGNEAWGEVNYEGAIVQYVGGKDVAKGLYRCPSLEEGIFKSGVGSNGLFDYTGLLAFTGARRYSVPNSATWRDPISGIFNRAPTPLIVEESPAQYLNLCCVDPGHSNVDRTGTWHNGGGNYIAFDGHSVRLRPDANLGPNTHEWTVKAPSGANVSLTSHSSGFGGWNNR